MGLKALRSTGKVYGLQNDFFFCNIVKGLLISMYFFSALSSFASILPMKSCNNISTSTSSKWNKKIILKKRSTGVT